MMGFHGDLPTQTYTCSHCGRRWEHLGHDGDCNCYASFVAASDRPRLDEAGYFLNDDGTWKKMISKTMHTARRDHGCGEIKAGDRYIKKTWRVIDDETGKSTHAHCKVLAATGGE